MLPNLLTFKDLYLFVRFVVGTKWPLSGFKILYFLCDDAMPCSLAALKDKLLQIVGSSFGRMYTLFIKMYFLKHIGPWIILNLPAESLTALPVLVLVYASASWSQQGNPLLLSSPKRGIHLQHHGNSDCYKTAVFLES